MKDYKELMEVMSMSDMNKVKGGTEQQRKIAQERQRRREEKQSKDKESTALAKREKKELPGQQGLPPADKAGAVTKRPESRPDVRKSQLGKWAEGIKKAPKPPVEKVNVKVDDAQAGNRPSTSRPAKPKKDVGNEVIKNMKKKSKNFNPEREARAKEKHDAWRADREAKAKAQKEKEAQAAHDATQKGQNEIAKKKKEEDRKKKKAEWNAKRPGSRAASVANKGRKAAGSGARKTLNLGKKVAGIAKRGLQGSVNSGLGASESGDLEGLSGKQSYE